MTRNQQLHFKDWHVLAAREYYLRSCTIFNNRFSAVLRAAEKRIYRPHTSRADGKCERYKISVLEVHCGANACCASICPAVDLILVLATIDRGSTGRELLRGIAGRHHGMLRNVRSFDPET
jgi:hypothetical protein